MIATVYGRTNPYCTYCEQAKQLLAKHDIPFTFVEVGQEISKEHLLEVFPGAGSVPQILLDGEPVHGGFTGLKRVLEG